MMPEEWPIEEQTAGQAGRSARTVARSRLATARIDFFLNPAERLTEQERAVMTSMLADLLGGISDEIRAHLPNGYGAANDSDGQRLVRDLGSAGLLNQAELIAILLRRADEERITTAVRNRPGEAPAFLQALIANADGGVSAAAMGLILARGRRRDRLGQPQVDFNDLPKPVARALATAVAAGIRTQASALPLPPDADEHFASAVEDVLRRHDPERGIGRTTASLVEALSQAGTLDDALIGAAAGEGDVAFVAEALAGRAGIQTDVAWEHMFEGERGRLSLLLRMAGVSRGCAARLLAALGDLLGVSDLGREIGRFESIKEEEATAARQRLRLPPGYRAALQAIGAVRG